MFNKNIFCNRRFRWFAIAVGITAACASGSHRTEVAALVATEVSAVELFEGIALEHQGSGKMLEFIPGLNSGNETFTETCAALVAQAK